MKNYVLGYLIITSYHEWSIPLNFSQTYADQVGSRVKTYKTTLLAMQAVGIECQVITETSGQPKFLSVMFSLQ